MQAVPLEQHVGLCLWGGCGLKVPSHCVECTHTNCINPLLSVLQSVPAIVYVQDEYRKLVVKWIYDTERSYLQALQSVIKVCECVVFLHM